jgi:hypothetical protein
VIGLLAAVFLAGAPCAPTVDVRGRDVPADIVDDFAADAAEDVVAVRARLGSTACEPLVVTLVPAMADAPRLDPPWHLPSWAAGAAEPEARRVVVGITANGAVQDRRRTLQHELAHVVVPEIVGGGRLPRWLDEGLARVVAGEHGLEDLSVLARARLVGRHLPLRALVDGFPPGPTDAALAYATAGRAVALLDARGDGVLRDVLRRIGQGEDVDAALVAVVGRATWQLDQDVQRSLDGWTALATVGVETDLAMALCAGVVAFFGVRARRRIRARLAAMVDDEIPLPAVHLVRFRLGPDTPPPSGAAVVGGASRGPVARWPA